MPTLNPKYLWLDKTQLDFYQSNHSLTLCFPKVDFDEFFKILDHDQNLENESQKNSNYDLN